METGRYRREMSLQAHVEDGRFRGRGLDEMRLMCENCDIHMNKEVLA